MRPVAAASCSLCVDTATDSFRLHPSKPFCATAISGRSQWQGKNQTAPERLRSEMLVIDYADTSENRGRIEAIRAAWKAKTGDESVMRVTEPVDVSF